MEHQIIELPYKKTELSPYVSEETLNYHHGKHHQAYVNNLNKLIKDTPNENKSLIDIIKTTDQQGVFNNAAQIWNHSFYWYCLTGDKAKQKISSELEDRIVSTFGSLEKFKADFTAKGLGQFGSGWAWLVQDSSGKLQIVSTANAEVPFKNGLKPLLTCDVWEHAYYVDYRNDRAKYIESFWNIVNWNFVAKSLASQEVFSF